ARLFGLGHDSVRRRHASLSFNLDANANADKSAGFSLARLRAHDKLTPNRVTKSQMTGRAPFLHRDFRLLQIARFASIVALQVQSVAVGWQVYQLPWRALDLGLVGLAQFVPSAALSMFAGHTADRYDRRGILLACNVAYAALALALAAYAWLGFKDTVPIYG